MKKKKLRSFESTFESTFILVQRRLESKNIRGKSKYYVIIVKNLAIGLKSAKNKKMIKKEN